MNMQEKNPGQGVKKFFIAWFSILILVLTGIGIMGRRGLELISAGTTHLLFGVLVVSAIIAAAWWIVGRITARWLKVFTGILFGVIAVGSAVIMYVVFTVMLLTSVPTHYTTLSNERCHAVVMRRLEVDFDGNNAPIYHYSVHPRAAGFFYNKKISGEGELMIPVESDAQLMYDWQDAHTIRLYAEGADEAGSLMLSFDRF